MLHARLLFDDANHPKCALAVESYRSLAKPQSRVTIASADAMDTSSASSETSLVKNWKLFLKGFPKPLRAFVENLNPYDVEIVEANILHSAKLAWKHAQEKNSLSLKRSKGWREAEEIVLMGKPTCPRCKEKAGKVRNGGHGRMFIRAPGSPEVLLSAPEICRQVSALWTRHKEILDLLYGMKGRRSRDPDQSFGHRHLFVKNVLVPPTRFRPAQVVSATEVAAEHPQNVYFQRLLNEINVIIAAEENGVQGDRGKDNQGKQSKEPVVRRPTNTEFVEATLNIQQALSDLYDSSGTYSKTGASINHGIRQQLEAKSGLFRQHMMGKRVNFSCRSVIGPDVFLDTDEIGIPESFAKLLTVPEPVGQHNLRKMRKAVLNGPLRYPGANGLETWTSQGDPRVLKFKDHKAFLKTHSMLLMQNRMHKSSNSKHHSKTGPQDLTAEGDDNAVAARSIPKSVHRHLRTGDIVLFNRQPTLHRVSIMAHRVRVLPGDRTIRFHYTNCNSYNADFDGDEMNVHVPQDYIARAEAEELMLSSKHYIVPTSGAPIRGLIQDHIAAAALLSRRDTFLSREVFTQLLYAATEKIMMRSERRGQRYVLPVPAVLKPVPLWTGKQLISSVLYVIRNGRPGLQLEAGAKTKSSIIGKEEADIVVRKGELLKGIIDKSSLGSSMYGLVHAIQEAYGCTASDDFLSSIGRLCLYFMRMHGHTTGVDDLVLQKRGDAQRAEITSAGIEKIGIEVTNEVYSAMSAAGADVALAKNSDDARRLIEEMVRRDGVEAEDRLDTAMKNALNKVSSSVMSACVPKALQKPFPRNGFALMTSTGAKGSPVNASQISCLLGSTVLEGKRVPRMGGSGATLPCFVPFDPSPLAGGFIASRFLTGITPQEFFFHAMSGREGLLDTSLKTANSGYLQRCLIKHLEGARVHYDGSVRNSDDTVLQFVYGDDGIDPCKSRWLMGNVNWQLNNRDVLPVPAGKVGDVVRREREDFATRKEAKMEGTIIEKVSPGAIARRGAISEKFESMIDEAVKGSNVKEQKVRRSFLEGRYQAAAVEPGEAVGVIAGQGVGEPSTQMTLNTFHHAGSSSAHVTLGIPRLRELLMTASKYPKTPSMTLPIVGENPERSAKRLQRRLQRVSLIDLMTQLRVREKSVHSINEVSSSAIRIVSVTLVFPEEDVYREAVGVTFKKLSKFVEKQLVPLMNQNFKREIRRFMSDTNTKKHAFRLYLRATTGKGDVVEGDDTGADGNHDGEGDVPVGKEDDEEMDGNKEGGGDGHEEEDGNASSSDEDISDDDKEEGGGEKPEASDDVQGIFMEEEVGNLDVETENAPMETDGDANGNEAEGDGNASKVILEGDEGDLYSSLGFIPSSLHGVSGTLVQFDWGLPIEMCGSVNLSRMVQEAARTVKLAEVDRISKCFIAKEEGHPVVITEGSNLTAIFEKGDGLIDFDALVTNDMYGILQVYGVEAMRTALVKEFVKVFDAYGIPVDIRHLQLIADYMTLNGKYRGFNRRSMVETDSVMQQMTFETSVKFLTEAALHGTNEPLRNPSAALAVSRMTSLGTGGFELYHRIN